MEKGKGKPRKDNLKGLYVLLLVVIVIWSISIFVVPSFYPDLNDRALLGDSFGTMNSLFSGLAFAGIIYTILLQRKELSLQRDELKETRKELTRSATAQEKSEVQQKRQSDNLKITARLNALNSLLNYHMDKEANVPMTTSLKNANRGEQEKYVQQIKEILEKKESGL